jgi:glyoxylate/hydroxypyruvate/2-ketogluconate reductase
VRPKVLVARSIFPEVIGRMEELFEVDVHRGEQPLSVTELCARLADKEGSLIMGDRIDAAVLRNAPRLRVVSNMSVGYSNCDIAACNQANVLVTNTPGVLDESVADFAWALMMNAARRIGESERWVRGGEWRAWSYDMYLGRDIYGSALGIIGMGRIGQAVARRAGGFGMKVLYFNRTRLPVALEDELKAVYLPKDDLLRRADHLMLTLPYSLESHHIVAAREIALMKKTATITNVARGGVVDDAALAAALRENLLAGAALDVYENEPRFLPDLLNTPNLVMTPHNAPGSERTRRAMANLAVDNLIAGLGLGPEAGNPPHPVNPEVLRTVSE